MLSNVILSISDSKWINLASAFLKPMFNEKAVST